MGEQHVRDVLTTSRYFKWFKILRKRDRSTTSRDKWTEKIPSLINRCQFWDETSLISNCRWKRMHFFLSFFLSFFKKNFNLFFSIRCWVNSPELEKHNYTYFFKFSLPMPQAILYQVASKIVQTVDSGDSDLHPLSPSWFFSTCSITTQILSDPSKVIAVQAA